MATTEPADPVNPKRISKVTYDEKVLIDLTADTVDAANLAKGYTAHDKSGVAITGTMVCGGYNITQNTLDSGNDRLVITDSIDGDNVITIIENGTYDVRDKSTAVVVVESSFDNEDGLIEGTISGEYSNDRIAKVRQYGFYGVSKLTSISFPNVTSASVYSFNGCSNLVSISMPKLTSIEASCFRLCIKLESVFFPEVNTIGNNAFGMCSKLISASFPKATSIEQSAFSNCSAFSTLILSSESTVCAIKNVNAFANTKIASGTGYIYVPDDLVDSYKTATNWVTYAAQIKPISELEAET